MKRIALALLPVVGLVGCGTLAPPVSESLAAGTSVVDFNRVALIDQAARNRGVQVVWINPPRKTLTSSGS